MSSQHEQVAFVAEQRRNGKYVHKGYNSHPQHQNVPKVHFNQNRNYTHNRDYNQSSFGNQYNNEVHTQSSQGQFGGSHPTGNGSTSGKF